MKTSSFKFVATAVTATVVSSACSPPPTDLARVFRGYELVYAAPFPTGEDVGTVTIPPIQSKTTPRFEQ
jgi:hypothetical protein